MLNSLKRRDMNSEDNIALRRFMNNLSNSGAACILFGFWNVLKLFIEVTMNKETYNSLTVDLEAEEYSEVFIRVVIILIVLMVAAFLMYFHLRIGISAIRYSKGKKKRRTYLPLTVVILLLNISGIGSNFTDETTGAFMITGTAIAATLVDLTFTFILFDIISSSIKIADLRKRILRSEAEGA